jgi:putative transposase
LRYETDLTDAEWALIEPFMPAPKARRRPRGWPLREVMYAIFYVLRGGISWRLLPRDLPPKSTVFGWFSLWRDNGLFETTESGGPRGYEAAKKVKGRKRQGDG